MTQLAFSNMEKVEVLDIELNRSGPLHIGHTKRDHQDVSLG